MELIKKLLDLIFEFFETRRANKIEGEETRRVIAEQQKRTSEAMNNKRNKSEEKAGTEEDFFNDGDWK